MEKHTNCDGCRYLMNREKLSGSAEPAHIVGFNTYIHQLRELSVFAAISALIAVSHCRKLSLSVSVHTRKASIDFLFVAHTFSHLRYETRSPPLFA